MGRLLARISLGKEEVQLSVTKIGVICFASFLFVKKKKKKKKSLRMHPRDNETYGDMARRPPRAEAHLKNTQAYICHSPNGFLCDKVNYSCPHSRGNTSLRVVLLQSSAFYERLYFYSIRINKSWCADSESAVPATAQASGRASFVFCQCLH